MSFIEAIIFGTISGLTIFFGMPVARIRALAKQHVAFLNAIAIGVLFFLLFDIFEHAITPIERALHGKGGSATLLIVIFIAGFTIGFLGLVYYGERLLRGQSSHSAQQLALMVAIGIGLHNLSEGLAIGQAAASGELSFAFILIIGFGLHNITEAFGIAAPLAGSTVSWRFLLMAGLIAGAPNALGTLVGYWFTSELLSILFLALAGGAIVFVLGELFAAGRKLSAHTWNGWGILIGFFAGLLTDFLLIALGT